MTPCFERITRAFVLFLSLGSSLAVGAAEAGPTRPIPKNTRALIVSIDGLRPDALLRADAPNLRALMARGTFTMWARTTDVAVTLPSHVSMLTGVPPKKHGVDWNRDIPTPIYPKWPTLFDVAHAAGLTTAAAAGKSKFTSLTEPKSLDWSFVTDKTAASDDEVTDEVLQWISASASPPQVLFVHLPGVDSAGHSKGWGSPVQLKAIATADRCIGRILAALESRGVLDSTFVLVSSDHGGQGRSHGANDTRSLTIPWIAAGPGICAGFDLASIAELRVRTEDTFATACWLLGLTAPKPIDGRAVSQIRCTDARQ